MPALATAGSPEAQPMLHADTGPGDLLYGNWYCHKRPTVTNKQVGMGMNAQCILGVPGLLAVVVICLYPISLPEGAQGSNNRQHNDKSNFKTIPVEAVFFTYLQRTPLASCSPP